MIKEQRDKILSGWPVILPEMNGWYVVKQYWTGKLYEKLELSITMYQPDRGIFDSVLLNEDHILIDNERLATDEEASVIFLKLMQ
jgi:hypothetical protein